MLFFRGDTEEERRKHGMCRRCGEHPPIFGQLNCPMCHGKVRTALNRTRARQQAEQRDLQAIVDARRIRKCREVTIVERITRYGPVTHTFIVVNSYDTPSSTGRVQKSDGPWK